MLHIEDLSTGNSGTKYRLVYIKKHSDTNIVELENQEGQ